MKNTTKKGLLLYRKNLLKAHGEEMNKNLIRKVDRQLRKIEQEENRP